MQTRHSSAAAVVAAFTACSATLAQVDYIIDDGIAETGLGIDPGEGLIWLNTFPVTPGGEIIDSIQAAWGRNGGVSALNGLSASLLIYEDATGGSPLDAVLKTRTEIIIANANTTTITNYPIISTPITGTLVIGAYFHNDTGVTKFIGPIDRTAPNLAGRSYLGFDIAIDPTNLGSIPAANFGTLESFGLAGNFVVRAHGMPIPAPGAFTVLGLCSGLAAFARGRRSRLP